MVWGLGRSDTQTLIALAKLHMVTQAGEMVPDEVQNHLMFLAIHDVARVISSQATPAVPAAAGGAKPAGKPAAGKAKKDEPKPVQVLPRLRHAFTPLGLMVQPFNDVLAANCSFVLCCGSKVGHRA